MASKKLSANQIAVVYPVTTISERWVKSHDGNDDLYAAWHPKIDTITGFGNTHEEARADLKKNRYNEYLSSVTGAGLWE